MPVKTYQEYTIEGNPDTLPSYSKDGKILHMCPSCGHYRKDFRIVDCRHIAVAIVEREWACDACWGMWIRESGRPDNLYEDIAEDCVKNPGKHGKEGKFKQTPNLRRNPHKMELRDDIVKMKRDGAIPRGKIRKHSFTQSQWMEMHGVDDALVVAVKGTVNEYYP